MNAIKSCLDKNGRLLIPLHLRKSLALKPGQEVLLYQEGEELKIRTYKDALTRARDLIKQYNPDNLDLVDVLLQHRREEASRD